MNKQEFVGTLRRELSGLSDYEYINDTVSYYENYIETEIRKGSSEEEVLGQLGDPRLIAKSIRASRGKTRRADSSGERVQEDEPAQNNNSSGLTLLNRFLSLPVWAQRVTGGIIAGGAIILSLALLRWLFPVLLVGGVAYMFYKFFRDNFMR